ncbi:hypothetical protein V8E53_005042 [Lactarius tabidus]
MVTRLKGEDCTHGVRAIESDSEEGEEGKLSKRASISQSRRIFEGTLLHGAALLSKARPEEESLGAAAPIPSTPRRALSDGIIGSESGDGGLPSEALKEHSPDENVARVCEDGTVERGKKVWREWNTGATAQDSGKAVHVLSALELECQQLIMEWSLDVGRSVCPLTETTALCDMWESDVGLYGDRGAQSRPKYRADRPTETDTDSCRGGQTQPRRDDLIGCAVLPLGDTHSLALRPPPHVPGTPSMSVLFVAPQLSHDTNTTRSTPVSSPCHRSPSYPGPKGRNAPALVLV